MSNPKLDSAIKMFRDDYKLICDDLKAIQKTLDRGADIDIRLCIDFDNDEPDWIIRSGDASYDQRHSDYCSASSINRKTKTKAEPCCEILESMINDGFFDLKCLTQSVIDYCVSVGLIGGTK